MHKFKSPSSEWERRLLFAAIKNRCAPAKYGIHIDLISNKGHLRSFVTDKISMNNVRILGIQSSPVTGGQIRFS